MRENVLNKQTHTNRDLNFSINFRFCTHSLCVCEKKNSTQKKRSKSHQLSDIEREISLYSRALKYGYLRVCQKKNNNNNNIIIIPKKLVSNKKKMCESQSGILKISGKNQSDLNLW